MNINMVMKYTRRRFVKNVSGGAASLGFSGLGFNLLAMGKKPVIMNNQILANIPRPIQVVIDDVGWWSGKDGSAQQEPYRTGINRNHCIADYKAIIELGRSLGIRPQAAMVLCEWDRENILKKLPNSTWMGEEWDNSKWVGTWLDEASELLRNNTEHFEFTMHGLGHELWPEKELTRAEWALSDGTMRSPGNVNKHLDFYQEIMEQNNLGPFPKSFVPTAFNHGFGLTGNHRVSLAELIKKRGVTYINTPFSKMQNLKDVPHTYFGMDSGVITVDRGYDLLKWLNIGLVPEGEIKGVTCGMHWPNLLHENPDRNPEIIEGWIKLLRPYQDRHDTMLASDSDYFQQQLIHHCYTEITPGEKSLKLNFKASDKENLFQGAKVLTVKVSNPGKLEFQSADLKIQSISEREEKGVMNYTLALSRMDAKEQAIISYKPLSL